MQVLLAPPKWCLGVLDQIEALLHTDCADRSDEEWNAPKALFDAIRKEINELWESDPNNPLCQRFTALGTTYREQRLSERDQRRKAWWANLTQEQREAEWAAHRRHMAERRRLRRDIFRATAVMHSQNQQADVALRTPTTCSRTPRGTAATRSRSCRRPTQKRGSSSGKADGGKPAARSPQRSISGTVGWSR